MTKTATCKCLSFFFFFSSIVLVLSCPIHCQQMKPYQFARLSVLLICLRLDKCKPACQNDSSSEKPWSTTFDHFKPPLFCHPQPCLTFYSEFERQHVTQTMPSTSNVETNKSIPTSARFHLRSLWCPPQLPRILNTRKTFRGTSNGFPIYAGGSGFLG